MGPGDAAFCQILCKTGRKAYSYHDSALSLKVKFPRRRLYILIKKYQHPANSWNNLYALNCNAANNSGAIAGIMAIYC